MCVCVYMCNNNVPHVLRDGFENGEKRGVREVVRAVSEFHIVPRQCAVYALPRRNFYGVSLIRLNRAEHARGFFAHGVPHIHFSADSVNDSFKPLDSSVTIIKTLILITL